MSRFGGSSEILGGVTVFIGADLEGLRTGVGEARRIASDAERTIGIKVPLMLADNGARLGMELTRVMSSMQAMASARPIRIPVILEPAGGGGFLPGGGGIGGGSRMARPGEITIGPPPGLPGTVGGGGPRMLPSPNLGASIGGGGFGGDRPVPSWSQGTIAQRRAYRASLGLKPGEVWSYAAAARGGGAGAIADEDINAGVPGGQTPNQTATGGGGGGSGTATIGPGVGGGGAGIGGGGGGGAIGGGVGGGVVVVPPGGGGGGGGAGRSGLGRGIRALFIAHAAASVLTSAADIAEYQRISQVGTPDEVEAARLKARQAVIGIPIAGRAGSAIGTLADDLGSNDPTGILGGIKSARTLVAHATGRLTDQEDEQVRREQAKSDLRADERFARNAARAAPYISLRDQTRAANETIGMSTTGAAAFQARQALGDFDTAAPGGQLRGAAKEARQELVTALANAIRQDAAAAAADLRSAGLTAAGISLAGNTAIINATRGTAIGGRAGLVGGIGLASAQLSNSIQTLLDQGVSPNDSRVQGLRLQLIAQQAAGAQQVAAHDINDIRDFERRNTDFGIRQLRRTAERIGNVSDVNDIDISQRHMGAIREAEDTYGPASAEAQRARYERDQAQGDTRRDRLEQEGRIRRRAAHRSFIEVPREQAEIDRRFTTEMGTRTNVANAQAGNEPILAGIIPLVAQMREEMRQVRVDQRPALAATQRAELGALTHRILQPNQYAAEFDPVRERAGGPGGQSGKDQTDLLKLIAGYLKDISDKGGGLGA